MGIVFELARPSDDAGLRALLARHPVPGGIAVTYEREPGYFAGCATHGPFCQVVVARDGGSGELAGVAVRATRPLYVNGAVEEVGYLGQLRVAEAYRGRLLVSRGFRFLRELHRDGRVKGYVTTIIEGNEEARLLLVERVRKGLPRYRWLADLLTCAFPVMHRRAPEGVEPAADLGEVAAFLAFHAARRQLFPVLSAEDLAAPGLTMLAIRRGGRIVGVLGLWDQAWCKQTVVHGYSGAMRLVRPLHDLRQRLTGGRPLPRPGQALRYVHASFPCVAADDPTVFRALLRGALARAAEQGASYVMLGLSGRDPLLREARRVRHVPYRSGLYSVAWEEEDGRFDERLDGRVPYVEIATL